MGKYFLDGKITKIRLLVGPQQPLVSAFESGVELLEGLAQKIAIEMRVDLGGGDAGMPKHFLYRTKIGSALYQMRGKGMPERMGRNGFVDACFLG
jgi:hypothetical protein